MKAVYPIILTPAERGYVVFVPDLDINTEGEDDSIYFGENDGSRRITSSDPSVGFPDIS